jgi:hypothetical protein
MMIVKTNSVTESARCNSHTDLDRAMQLAHRLGPRDATRAQTRTARCNSHTDSDRAMQLARRLGPLKQGDREVVSRSGQKSLTVRLSFLRCLAKVQFSVQGVSPNS